MVLPRSFLCKCILFLLFNPTFSQQDDGTAVPIPVQPEGVAHITGNIFAASDVREGSIMIVDADSGFVTTFIQPSPGVKVSFGLDYNAKSGILFAAGAGIIFNVNKTISAYDVVTATVVADCSVGAFINDVTSDDDFAYFTDSFAPFVHKLSIAGLPNCDIESIPIPFPEFALGEQPVVASNGIALLGDDGFLIVHFTLETIFYFNPKTPSKNQKLFPDGSLPGADGIQVVTMKRKKGNLVPRNAPLLYVAQATVNMVSVWKIIESDNEILLSNKRNITSSIFDTPSTVAVSPLTNKLVVANSNFDDYSSLAPLPEILPTFSVGVVDMK